MVPVLTANLTNGFAATIDVNLDGTTSVTNFSQQTTIDPSNPVPEPSSLMLAVSSLALFGVGVIVRRCAPTF